MNDLRESMRSATAELPPTGIDLDRLIEREHRHQGWRRVAATGVILLATVGGGLVGAAALRGAETTPLVVTGPLTMAPCPDPSTSDGTAGTAGRARLGTAPVPTEPVPAAVKRLSAVLETALAQHLAGRTIAAARPPGCYGVLFDVGISPSLYQAQVNFHDASGTGSLTVMINDQPYPGMSAYPNVHTLPGGVQVGWLGGVNPQLGVSRPDGTQITIRCDNAMGPAAMGGQPAAPATVDELVAIATDPGFTLYP